MYLTIEETADYLSVSVQYAENELASMENELRLKLLEIKG